MDGGERPRGIFVPVALSSRRPPIGRWVAIVAIALVALIAKPWAVSDRPTPGEGGARRDHSTPTVRPDVAAVPSPSDGAGALVASFCLDPGSWLVASVERWRDQRIKVWRALEPAASARGPGDPTIPLVSFVSEGLTELGWCAPVIGTERPAAPVDVTVWRRTGGVASTLTVVSSRPLSGHSAFGDLYRPPSLLASSRGGTWSAGTYVFRYRENDGRVRWFAVEVEIRPEPSRAP